QTCPVCIGLPGTLPVMNRKAYELGLRTAVALNCQIAPYTKWDRKNYYYPDLPKGYQISQYDLPFSANGWLDISDPKGKFEPKRVGITRAHLEEDAGKSMHDEQAGKSDSRIDLNRTGTPLLEIVSEPDMRSALEAKAYLSELRLLLTYLGVSDCNMQEGSLRVDANVNLHIPQGDRLAKTPIVEIKNLNSFRAVERAITYEAERQYQVWQETKHEIGDAPKQTRGWDDAANVTRGQRSKEESSDYRYFPDPDLTPVTVTVAEVDAVRAALGELPAALRTRLETSYGISDYDSDVIVNAGMSTVDYFVAVADKVGDGKVACNWVTQDVARVLNEQNQTIEQFPISATELADLIRRVKGGDFDTSKAREIFAEILQSGKSVADVVAAKGIKKVDESELIALCRKLLEANPQIVADVKAGKQQAAGNLIGQAKKQNPNVNPGRVREIIADLIASML
ncbi:MAG: Asp-tRNA(Asn)/Glu-tRNA(Gln) amidotransferase subunit GatB, partial [Planctomycetota bacterium]|nr:Asp-tRNA(Asn)/Glu-tRNA(Gln) amidotransferase subunit GatB [Planctomycetota bacterium]